MKWECLIVMNCVKSFRNANRSTSKQRLKTAICVILLMQGRGEGCSVTGKFIDLSRVLLSLLCSPP
jgi:hypothetical protein